MGSQSESNFGNAAFSGSSASNSASKAASKVDSKAESSTMFDPSGVELPPKYYLDNFRFVLDHVRALYEDILTAQESAFADDFNALSEDAQCLYVRLLSRRGDWFRTDKLNYSEISDINAAADELAAEEFLEIFDSGAEAVQQDAAALGLFTRPEVASCLSGKGVRSLSKAALMERVLEYGKEDSSEYEDVDLKKLPPTRVLCVFGELEMETYRLLFFGNLYQDFTEFVLRDLGLYRYEDYQIDTDSRWCHSREQLEQQVLYYELRNEAGDLRDLVTEALLQIAERVPDETDALLRRRTQRFLADIARQLERSGEAERSLAVYERSHRHPARERRLRILVSLNRLQEADQLAATMAERPYSEEEHQFLLNFVPRKMKHNAGLCESLIEKTLAPAQDILTMPAAYRLEHGVERAVALSLTDAHPEDHVLYCENLLVPGVFGLVFWPLLFEEVPGAFFHPFQIRPADLYDEEFTAVRQTSLESCWAALDSQSSFEKAVWNIYDSKFGIANPFIHWGGLTKEILELALSRISTEVWRGLFRFLLKDLRNHKAGLPDLIRFPAEGGFELLEVKGPGDTLQKNQKAWFAEFHRLAIPARVIRVKDEP